MSILEASDSASEITGHQAGRRAQADPDYRHPQPDPRRSRNRSGNLGRSVAGPGHARIRHAVRLSHRAVHARLSSRRLFGRSFHAAIRKAHGLAYGFLAGGLASFVRGRVRRQDQRLPGYSQGFPSSGQEHVTRNVPRLLRRFSGESNRSNGEPVDSRQGPSSAVVPDRVRSEVLSKTAQVSDRRSNVPSGLPEHTCLPMP